MTHIRHRLLHLLRRNQAGLTLIELIVTMAIAAILVTVATFGMRTMTFGSILNSANNNFIAALNSARGEAVTRASRISLCPSADGSTCAGNSWENGWIIFVDTDADGVRDAGEELLRVYAALNNPLTLRTGAAGNDYFMFNPMGASVDNAGAMRAVTFRLCDSRGTASAFAIGSTAGGRVRSQRGAAACP